MRYRAWKAELARIAHFIRACVIGPLFFIFFVFEMDNMPFTRFIF